MSKSIQTRLSKKISKRLRVLADMMPDPHRQFSYSQEGEDRLVFRLLRSKADGFFVDVGAHHPRRFSNTYLFYRLGWSGINIDAAPGTKERFRRDRPRDTTIETLVSDRAMSLEFHIFSEPALNTTDSELAESRIRDGRVRLRRCTMNARRLDEILQEHLVDGRQIDLLNIDVEGADLAVLRSNDWIRFRPSVVLVENLASAGSVEEVMASETHRFLSINKYRLFAKMVNTCCYLA